MLTTALFVLSGTQAFAAQPPRPPYPVAKPERILQSPDWSDYRIYPKSAADLGHEGWVKAEALIGSNGAPKACHIVQSSSFTDLDSGTCALVMQMRFAPARDGSGRAVESRYAASVNWHLTDALPFGSASLKVNVTLRDRHIVDCQVQDTAGPYSMLWRTNACSYLADIGYFFGSHAADGGRFTVEYRLDAGDGRPMLQAPWASGVPIAHEKTSFTIAPSGDPANCVPIESDGFGARGIRTQSPCGPMLAVLYFQPPNDGTRAAVRRGMFETRVFAAGPSGN